MRGRLVARNAVLGSLLVLAACEDTSTIESNDTSKFVATASAERSTSVAEHGNGKASMFGVPREARILFW
jgi:hypothetical protein